MGGALAITAVQSASFTVGSTDGIGADVYADRGGPLIPGIVNAAQSAGAEVCDVHIQEPSLETLFLHHTGRSLRD